VLQRLLNSDKRTLLAPTGVGSPGKETTNFGKGTKGALKRFQALFIEYIEVADGVFNDKTRQVVQTICNEEGKYANFGDKQGSKITAPKEKTPPPPGANITLSTDDLVVNVGQDFKVLVSVDKEVKGLPSESFIIDGATMKDVRKMSKLSYIVFFTPAENAKVAVIQIEAEKVTSTDGGKNEFASNEVVVKVLGGGVDTQNATPTNIFGNISQTLEGLLQSALGERPQTKFCNGVQIPFDSPCNPSIGNPGGGSGSGEGSGGGSSGGGGGGEQKQNPMQQMGQVLSGLLGGLGGKGGGQAGGQDGGGGPGGGGPGGGGPGGSGPGGAQPDLETPNTSPQPNGPIVIPENIPEACKKNYGLIVTGGCSTKDLTGKVHPKVAKAGMEACAASGGPVKVTSVHRTPACNSANGGAPKSKHLSGAAVDIPPGQSLIRKVLLQNGFKELDESNHLHFSAY
jgi:hypothetical protein